MANNVGYENFLQQLFLAAKRKFILKLFIISH
jgi:hypothetical protein